MELRHTIDFLTELTYNNNRDWFLDHKEDYLHAKAEYEDFVNRLIIGINAFDPAVGLQTAASCSYRIYRDVRFSRDKSPYKTWMGAYMCPGGRKSGRPGYYFHIEPVSDILIGHHLLAAGLYQPSPKTLRNIRTGILEHGRSFDMAVKAAKGFTLDEGPGERLQRTPPGSERFPVCRLPEMPPVLPSHAYKRRGHLRRERPLRIQKHQTLHGLHSQGHGQSL